MRKGGGPKGDHALQKEGGEVKHRRCDVAEAREGQKARGGGHYKIPLAIRIDVSRGRARVRGVHTQHKRQQRCLHHLRLSQRRREPFHLQPCLAALPLFPLFGIQE